MPPGLINKLLYTVSHVRSPYMSQLRKDIYCVRRRYISINPTENDLKYRECRQTGRVNHY